MANKQRTRDRWRHRLFLVVTGVALGLGVVTNEALADPAGTVSGASTSSPAGAVTANNVTVLNPPTGAIAPTAGTAQGTPAARDSLTDGVLQPGSTSDQPTPPSTYAATDNVVRAGTESNEVSWPSFAERQLVAVKAATQAGGPTKRQSTFQLGVRTDRPTLAQHVRRMVTPLRVQRAPGVSPVLNPPVAATLPQTGERPTVWASLVGVVSLLAVGMRRLRQRG